MDSWTIEMLWKCSCCGRSGNKGLERRCANCGWPKGPKDIEYFPSDTSRSAALKGEKDLEARSGKDWNCSYCKTLVRSAAKCCTYCGADKESGEQPWEHIKKTQIDGVTIEKTNNFVPQTNNNYSSNNFDDDYSNTYKNLRKNNLSKFSIFSIAFSAILVISLIVYMVIPKEVNAKSELCKWNHVTEVERYQIISNDGWRPPGNAINPTVEGKRIHHYDKVLVGSHQEPYQDSYACGQNCTTIPGSCHTTPRSCHSNGNGTATCSGGNTVCSPSRQSCSTKYCYRTAYKTVQDYKDVPVYKNWWTWKEWAWRYNRTLVKNGIGINNIVWTSEEEIQKSSGYLKDGERERSNRRSNYSVLFVSIEDKEDKWEIIAPSLSHYKNWCEGSWKLKISKISADVIQKL